MKPAGPGWSYSDASAFVRKLGIRTSAAYFKWAAGKDPDRPPRPSDFPSNPQTAYANWSGFPAFLGTKSKAGWQRSFLPYAEARAFVVSLQLRSGAEWKEYAAGRIPTLGPRPENIPSNPSVVYRSEGWCGMRHWLGNGGPSDLEWTTMVPYEEAQKFVRGLGIRGLREWEAYKKGKMPHLPPRPFGVPARPEVAYLKRGWTGWGAFLGTNRVANFEARTSTRPSAAIDRRFRIARFVHSARGRFDSDEALHLWMNTALAELNGETPLAVVASGRGKLRVGRLLSARPVVRVVKR